tara:strand:+ start:7925 stop:8620 length:696 start_codon:yes stop_codon:yes gene_type:complete
MSNIVAVVQARMQSVRLPKKSLLKLKGYPIIYWVNNGLIQSKLINKIIYAIPNNSSDDILEKYINKLGQNVYRGDNDNLLNRIYQASVIHDARYIIRVCADNPFVSGKEIDNLIRFYIKNSYDYVYNHIPTNNNFPNGLGAEMVNIELLTKLVKIVKEKDHKEHVFNFLWDNKEIFKIGTFNSLNKNISYPDLKLDIDTKKDLDFFNNLDLNIKMKTEDIIKTIRERNNEN